MSSLPQSQRASAGRGTAQLLYPLSEFYKSAGHPLPGFRPVPGSAIPEPFRRLLVHERDMTPTLEEAWGQKLHVRALRHELRESIYLRQSLLLVEDDKTVTAMGAISIDLDCFSSEARRLIREARVPLGGILRDHGIEHRCKPSLYFELTAGPMIGGEFGVDAGATLYGRRNVMWDSGDRIFAEVVEILPPVNPFAAAPGKDIFRG